MITTFAYTLVFGKPMIMYFGIITYLLLLSTAGISVLNVRYGKHFIPFKWHSRFAVATIVVATIHAALGVALFYNI